MPGSWDGMGDRSTPHKDHRCAHRSLPSAPGTFRPWEPLPRHQAAGTLMFCCLSFSWLVVTSVSARERIPARGSSPLVLSILSFANTPWAGGGDNPPSKRG